MRIPGLFLMAVFPLLCPAPLRAYQDTPQVRQDSNSLPPLFPQDGISKQVELPFAPAGLTVSERERFAVAFREERDQSNRIQSTRWVGVDLDTMKVTPQVTIPGRVLKSVCRFPWAAAITSERKVLVFQLPEMELRGELPAPRVSRLWILGDRYLDVGEERYRLDTLRPVTGEWSILNRGPVQQIVAGANPVWYFGSFLYDDSLTDPIRYVGRSWSPPNFVTVSKPGRRLAPGLRRLASTSAWTHGALARLSTPLAPPAPGQNSWLRFELITLPARGSTTQTRPLVQNSLLAAIRVNLPDQDGYRRSDLTVGSPRALIASGSGRRFVASIHQLLMLFEISAKCQQTQLPHVGPAILTDDLPVIIGDDEEIPWKVRLADNDDELTRFTGVGMAADYESGILTLSGMRLSVPFLRKPVESWPPFQRVLMSPKANWDEQLAEFRRHLGKEWEVWEKLAGRKLKGVPLEIPAGFSGTTKKGNRVDFRAGFILDFHSQRFQDRVAKSQAARLALITAPAHIADSISPDLSVLPIRNGQLQDRSLPELPDAAELLPDLPPEDPAEDLPPPVIDVPEIRVEPFPDESVERVGLEAGANFAVTALIGFLMILLSCRLHGSSRPEDEPFAQPAAGRIALSAAVLSLFAVGLDLPAIAVVRQFVNSDGWHVLPAAAVIVAISGFVRLLLAATGLKFLLRVSGEELLELLLVLCLLSVIPTLGWLGGFVYFCLS